MITKDNLPINSTEKEGLRYLMKTIVPLYNVPGRKKMSSLIDEKYNVLSDMIKNKDCKLHNSNNRYLDRNNVNDQFFGCNHSFFTDKNK